MDREAPVSKSSSLYLQFIGVWIILQIALVVIHSSPVLTGELLGPDSYMRIVRVQEFLAHGQWHNSDILRANAPYGDALHWTRPFDVLLLAIATPIALFTGWDSALFWASAVVSPLLLLACGLAIIWAMTPVIRPNSWLLPAIAILIQPGIVAYSMLGRADHHGLLLLVFVFSIGCMLRGLNNRFDGRIFLIGGMLAGFAVWLSVETLLSVVAIASALAIAWLINPENRARQGLLFGLGMLAVLALAMVSAHPQSQWLKPLYDKVSVVHLLLAAILFAFWCLVQVLESRFGRPKTWPERCLLVVVFAVPALGLLYRLYPSFFSGPMADVDPAIVPIWLDRVIEMKDIMPNSQESLGEFIFYLGQGLIALPYLLWKLWREREDPAWNAWLGLAVTIAFFWPVATMHVRFSSFAEVLFIIVLAEFIDRALQATEAYRNMVVRALSKSAAICLVLVGAVGIGSLLMNAGEAEGRTQSAKSAPEVCSMPEISRFLETADNWPTDAPQTILTFIDLGPELLYRTRHQVLATPYHRNGDGIRDSHTIMTSDDLETAKAMMDERAVNLVLLCPNSAERVFFHVPKSDAHLYALLRDGTPPPWLVPVELPENLSGEFKLYEKRF